MAVETRSFDYGKIVKYAVIGLVALAVYLYFKPKSAAEQEKEYQLEQTKKEDQQRETIGVAFSESDITADIFADKYEYSRGEDVKITVEISNNTDHTITGNIKASAIAEKGVNWNDMTVLSFFDIWSGVTVEHITLNAYQKQKVRFAMPLSQYAESGRWGVYTDSSLNKWKENVFSVKA